MPVFSVASSKEPTPATSTSSTTLGSMPKGISKGSSKGKVKVNTQTKSEAKGHGDMADMAKLNKVFGGLDLDFLLNVPDDRYVLLDGLDELLQQHLLDVTSATSVSSHQETWQNRNDSSRERGSARASSRRPHSPTRNHDYWNELATSSTQHSSWAAYSDWSSSWWNEGSSRRDTSWSTGSQSYSSHSWYQDKRQR